MENSYDRQVYDFLTGSGQHQVSSLIGGSRQRTLSWRALHADNFALLDQFWTGAMGTGPWALIDPSMPNMLLPNQAAAGSTYNDARHWVTVTGAANEGAFSANSTSTFIHRAGAPRSIRWLFAVAAATVPVARFTPPYRSWFGFPVVPALPYSLAMWLRADGVVDSNITFGLRLKWMDAAGVEIPPESSNGNNSVTTTWVRQTVTGTAPAGAAYVEPRMVITGSSVTTGGSLYIDEPMLEQDSVVNNWAPATGIRPVEIMSLPDVVPFNARFRQGVTMVLRELAP